MLAAGGQHPGYSCTEGVFVAGEQSFSGDYSGPAGARAVLRDQRVTAAVLETARGGMLRRGLATAHADVAVVTNISADHFGEYGVESLEDLADVKLIVARALYRGGTLVLNGDDPVLMRRSSHLWPKVAVFAGVFENTFVKRKLREGGLVCAMAGTQLRLVDSGETLDLGLVDEMPLSAGGAATYNIANMAAAAIAAKALHVPVTVIREVLHTFGKSRFDNPGRLEQWHINGVHVLLDYAHNPAGLAGLMSVARSLSAASGASAGRVGRIGLLLGQAGNREDDDVRALGIMAASFAPDLIVLKDIDGMLRGRAPGEVPAMLHESLLTAGFDGARIQTTLPEFDAAKQLFRWAQSGDVVVMPMHGVAPRVAIRAWLDAGAG
jgi:UDP-N-acetylmuramyl tripeptide synthase